ncbi:MAG: heparinase II/III-family protein, partial [Clostridiales bacterium]|nr:heparinase II/III-family protein [Clostridiales bacterium]
GVFRREQADPAFLRNTDPAFKDRGEGWCADDGLGWLSPPIDASSADHRLNTPQFYNFIAYYNRSLWFIPGRGSDGSYGLIIESLNAFRDAYILAGDVRFAKAGLALLERVADIYPDMDCRAYPKYWGLKLQLDRVRAVLPEERDALLDERLPGLIRQPWMFNGDGNYNNGGKILGSIEESRITPFFSLAYDAFKPEAGRELREKIENGILREIYPAVKKSRINGNGAMHQYALAAAAFALDKSPETQEWLAFNDRSGVTLQPHEMGVPINCARYCLSDGMITGGDILRLLVDEIDRDGFTHEGSMTYSGTWLNSFMELSGITEAYRSRQADGTLGTGTPGPADGKKTAGADAAWILRFKLAKMFSAFAETRLCGKYTAAFGDAFLAGQPVDKPWVSQCAAGVCEYRDASAARLLSESYGGALSGLHGGIFEPSPDLETAVGDILAGTAPETKSVNLAGAGFAALADGARSPDTRRALSMYYGRSDHHGQADTLNLGLYAFGLNLAPDLGYPVNANRNGNRIQWSSNTIAHNTVTVDAAMQVRAPMQADPLHFAGGGPVQLIDADASRAYPQTSVYRRTAVTVRIDEASSYIVDFFLIKGGREHVYSFHGAEASAFDTRGLRLKRQEDAAGAYAGTYAGPDIPYPPGGAVSGEIPEGSAYDSGYGYLVNVQRDERPAAPFSADWRIVDTYGVGCAGSEVHLKLTMLSPVDDVAFADGAPPQKNPVLPSAYRYLLARRKAADDSGAELESCFVSVIEPYNGESLIADIRAVLLAEDARAVKVTLKSGRVDYVAWSPDGTGAVSVDGVFGFQGFFAFRSQEQGKAPSFFLHDAVSAEGGPSAEGVPSAEGGPSAEVTGSVVDFTRELSLKNEIITRLDGNVADLARLEGQYVYIKGWNGLNQAYPILGAKALPGGLAVLDTGDLTPVRKWADSGDFSKGFEYYFPEGAPIRIPLSCSY